MKRIVLEIIVALGVFSNTTYVDAQVKEICKWEILAGSSNRKFIDVACGDIGYGETNFITLDKEHAQVLVWRTNPACAIPTTIFATEMDIRDTSGFCKITAGDYNHDGKVELAILSNNIVANHIQGGKLVLYSFNITSGKMINTDSLILGSGINDWVDITSGDFNGDGKTDIAICKKSGPQIYLIDFNTTEGKLELRQTISLNNYKNQDNWKAISSGDYDNNGFSELLAIRKGYRSSTGRDYFDFIIWGFDKNWSYVIKKAFNKNYNTVHYEWNEAASGNFDGNASNGDEFAVSRKGSDNFMFYKFINNKVLPYDSIKFSSVSNVIGIAAGDLKTDNRSDEIIALANSSNGVNSALYSIDSIVQNNPEPILLSYFYPVIAANTEYLNPRMSTPNIIDVCFDGSNGDSITRNCWRLSGKKLLCRVDTSYIRALNNEQLLYSIFENAIKHSDCDGLAFDELAPRYLLNNRQDTVYFSDQVIANLANVFKKLKKHYPQKLIYVYDGYHGAWTNTITLTGNTGKVAKTLNLNLYELFGTIKNYTDSYVCELYLNESTAYLNPVPGCMVAFQNSLITMDSYAPGLLKNTLILLGAYVDQTNGPFAAGFGTMDKDTASMNIVDHLAAQIDFYLNNSNTAISAAAKRGIGIYAPTYLYINNYPDYMGALDKVIWNRYFTGTYQYPIPLNCNQNLKTH